MPPKSFYNDGREAALHQHVLSQNPSNATEVLDVIDEYVTSTTGMMIFQKPKVDAARVVVESLDPKPKVLVELGGYVGKSAIAWGQMLKSLHPPPRQQGDGPKVFSMELEPNFVNIIRDFVNLAGLNDTVQVLQGQSSDSLRSLQPEHGVDTIDILFLDHWEKFYLSDLKVCEELKLLRKGSVVIADNTDMPGAPDYLAYVEGGGDNGWKYRCESVNVAREEGKPGVVHFAFVEETPA